MHSEQRKCFDEFYIFETTYIFVCVLSERNVGDAFVLVIVNVNALYTAERPIKCCSLNFLVLKDITSFILFLLLLERLINYKIVQKSDSYDRKGRGWGRERKF